MMGSRRFLGTGGLRRFRSVFFCTVFRGCFGLQAGARMHGQRVGQGAVLQIAQHLGHAGEKLFDAGAGTVQAVEEIRLLQAFDTFGIVAAVQRDVVFRRILAYPGSRTDKDARGRAPGSPWCPGSGRTG